VYSFDASKRLNMVAIGTYNCFVTCKSELMALRPLAEGVFVACINEPLLRQYYT